MADVFISYSKKDREVAQALADFLEKCGYEIWWDYELVGGEKFRSKIKEELTKAKAAIVIWTPNSVESDFVIEEADEATQSRKLIATRVEHLDFRAIPLGFRGVETVVVNIPERILRALEKIGVLPSRPPNTTAAAQARARLDEKSMPAFLERLSTAANPSNHKVIKTASIATMATGAALATGTAPATITAIAASAGAALGISIATGGVAIVGLGALLLAPTVLKVVRPRRRHAAGKPKKS
jgi:hypothetical protein